MEKSGKCFNKNEKIELILIEGKGKGKEYDYNGVLEFEGEYLNGERIEKKKDN